MQHQTGTNTKQSSNNTTGSTASPKPQSRHDFSSLKLPSIKSYARANTSPTPITEQSPDRPVDFSRSIREKIVESLSFMLKLSSSALLWTTRELLRVFAKLRQPTAKGPVDILVARALSGPPDKHRSSAGRTWPSFAKQQFMEIAARMEPAISRETRKIMSYENSYLSKFGSLLSQLAHGLPRADGKHINPTRVSALPCEYNDPYLQRVYDRLRRQHFPNRADVDDYKVVWRDRPMRTKEGSGTLRDTLGYIEYGTRTIHIAREMSHPDAVRWLPALVHHELCHAILVDFLEPTQDAHAEWFKRLNGLHEDARGFESWGGWHSCYDSYHRTVKKSA